MEINKITIDKVRPEQMNEIIDYVLNVRKGLFPMLDHSVIPWDILKFEETYYNNTLGEFLQARNQEGKLLGVIGMMEYNHRFQHLDYPYDKVVEVARLFVEPECRRLALGTQMVKELNQIAINKGIELMYLHTHPFLKGAYEFWLNQGYGLDKKCIESKFETIHMSKYLMSKEKTKNN